jgi:hypothetical protein
MAAKKYPTKIKDQGNNSLKSYYTYAGMGFQMVARYSSPRLFLFRRFIVYGLCLNIKREKSHPNIFLIN